MISKRYDPVITDTREADEQDEVRALRGYLAAMKPESERRLPPDPDVPFDELPAIEPGVAEAIEAAALEANDRYLETFLEPHSFCPFSRGGRSRGQTARSVYYASTMDLAPLYQRMEAAARDTSKVVIQVILPLIEVSPRGWIDFCHALTAAGNQRLGDNVFVVAPLHPELPYTTDNPHALIPLLRRTPDPTIQWVRTEALDALYEGRTGDTVFVDPEDLATFLAKPKRSPLYDRIAESNMKMAKRLGIPEVERSLRQLAREAHERYARILLGDAPPRKPPPRRLTAPVTDGSPPRPALQSRDGHWALLQASELRPRAPLRFLADGVELVVIQGDHGTHVLHGRCPHRHAPLTDAIVEEHQIVCPHHGWDFNLATGRSAGVPGAAVARFRCWVDEGLLWVDGDELRTWKREHVQTFRDDDDVL